MTSDIKFSVTVPAYKAQFLAECIDSIMAQTYKNFELIIVNDASPQDLDSIVKKYDDPRIHYYKNKVGFGAEHVVGNWNKCLEYATGDYVICMGDDDRMLPNCLEEYARMIPAHPEVDIFHVRVQFINEKSEVFGYQEVRSEEESVYAMIYWRLIKHRTQFIGDYAFRTSTLRKNGGFYDLPCGWSSDEISCYVAAKDHGIVNSNTFGFQFRISTVNISGAGGNYKTKINAYRRAKAWYETFLTQPAKTEEDKVYQSFIKAKIEERFYITFFHFIGQDVKEHPITNSLYWLMHRKKYGFNWKTVIKGIMDSIVYKFHL